MIVQFGGGSPTCEDVRVTPRSVALKPTIPGQVGCEKSSGPTNERNHDRQAASVSTIRGTKSAESRMK